VTLPYAAARRGGPASKRRGVNLPVLLFLAPAFLIMGYVVAYPLLRTFVLSLFHLELVDPDHQAFVGAGNFLALARDVTFWQSLARTAVFTSISVVVSFVFGLGFALLADGLPARAAFGRGLLLVPWVTPAVVVGFLFLYMFDQEVGVVNLLLLQLHVIQHRLAWLSDANLAPAAVIVANVWSQTPFFILMFAAGLTAIPAAQREAIRIDGARGWEEFWHLIVPYLRHIMVIASLIAIINNFNSFTVIWTMTQGGPVYATTTLAVQIYRVAFQQFKFGYGAAMGVVWMLVLLVLSVVYIRTLQREALT
jgi:multiple sugar transport system permease protein